MGAVLQVGMLNFQRKFFNLAKWMLACNLAAMGGKPYGPGVPDGTLEFHLLGLSDNCTALWALCQKQLGKQIRFEPGKGWSAN
jgi:hypothetical protein